MKLLAVENHPAQAAMWMIHLFCAGARRSMAAMAEAEQGYLHLDALRLPPSLLVS